MYLGFKEINRSLSQNNINNNINPSRPPSVYPSPSVKNLSLTIDLPLFYPGIQWEAKQSGQQHFRNDKNDGIEMDGYSNQSVILGSCSSSFPTEVYSVLSSYYDKELQKRGWISSSGQAASGPGGHMWGYEKNGNYVALKVGCYQNSQGVLEGYRAYISYNIPGALLTYTAPFDLMIVSYPQESSLKNTFKMTIYTSWGNTIDPATIDPSTLALGTDYAKPLNKTAEIVNGTYGTKNAVYYFDIKLTGIASSDKFICYTGKTITGLFIGSCNNSPTLP